MIVARPPAPRWVPILAGLFLCCFYWKADNQARYRSQTTDHSRTIADHVSVPASNTTRQQALARLQLRLRPEPLVFSSDRNTTLASHQFLHLHHMKTGGTSIDKLLQCNRDRLNTKVLHKSLHECGEYYYQSCVSRRDEYCWQQMRNASMLSFCAPVADLATFEYIPPSDHVQAVTILRHPVARIWSYYRFRRKSCFQCRSLLDVYLNLDSLTDSQCRAQLENHMTTNLLPSSDGNVQDAIDNMQENFLVGLTERLNETVDLMKHIFPWLLDTATTSCPLSHSNAAKTFACGGAWLPNEPDEATTAMILQYNADDLLLYDAARLQFDLQREVLTA